MLEEAHCVGPGLQLPLLVGGEARGDEVLRPPCFVDGGDRAVASAGEGAGAVDGLAQDGADVEAGADAQDGAAQAGDALAQRLDFPLPLVA